jgi:hypothetical protein
VIEDPPVAPAVKGIETVVSLVAVGVPIVGDCGTVVAVKDEEAPAIGPVIDTLTGVTFAT